MDDPDAAADEPGSLADTPAAAGKPEQAATDADSSVDLSSMAGLSAALFGIAAAVWYAILSFGANLAYDPAGVQPHEVGLGSPELLTQAGTPVIASLAVVVIVVACQQFVARRFGGDEHATGRAQSPSMIRRAPLVLAIAVSTFLVLGGYLAIDASFEARSAIRDGRRPMYKAVGLAIGLPAPWRAEVADLAWATDPPAGAGRLPSCVLYLGEADGTTVAYVPAKLPAHRRTLRLPSSSVVVTISRQRDRC